MFQNNLKCFGIIFMGNFLLQTKLFEICSKTNLNVSETFELFRKRLEMNKNSIYWKLFIWNQLKQMVDLLMGRSRPQTSAAPVPARSFLRCDRIKSHEAIYRCAREGSRFVTYSPQEKSPVFRSAPNRRE